MKSIALETLKWAGILYLVIAVWLSMWDGIKAGLSDQDAALDRGTGVSLSNLVWPLRWAK